MNDDDPNFVAGKAYYERKAFFKKEVAECIKQMHTPVGECICCKGMMCGWTGTKLDWSEADLLKFGPNLEFLLCRRCAVNNPSLSRLSISMGINAFLGASND